MNSYVKKARGSKNDSLTRFLHVGQIRRVSLWRRGSSCLASSLAAWILSVPRSNQWTFLSAARCLKTSRHKIEQRKKLEQVWVKNAVHSMHKITKYTFHVQSCENGDTFTRENVVFSFDNNNDDVTGFDARLFVSGASERYFLPFFHSLKTKKMKITP